LICQQNTYVRYLSTTYEGSVHDKTIADEEDLEFEETITLLQDLGFQGYAPDNVEVVQPIKKSRNKELTYEQKSYNKEQAQKHVYVEHAIRGIKIMHIVKGTIRSHLHAWRDLVCYLACGIHNFKIYLKTKNKQTTHSYSIIISNITREFTKIGKL
jgi:hypothetical protein